MFLPRHEDLFLPGLGAIADASRALALIVLALVSISAIPLLSPSPSPAPYVPIRVVDFEMRRLRAVV